MASYPPRLVALSVLLAVSSLCTSAHADAEADAKDLFSRGRELRIEGKCVEALVDFRRAISIFPAALGSARNVAECEETLGRWASARRSWLDLERAAKTSSDPRYQTWSADAAAAAARLAPKVAHLTVDVVVVGMGGEVPAAAAASVTVFLEGEPLPPTLIGSPLDRDPGSYTVRLAGPPGATAAVERVVLAAGDDKKVVLQITVPPGEGARAAPGSAPASEPDDPHRVRRTVGWITLGAGGAALVGAGISAIVRATALADLRRDCPDYAQAPCGASVRSEVSRGQAASTLVDVLGAGFVVGAGAGTALILVSPSSPGVALRPTIGRINGVMMEWSLR